MVPEAMFPAGPLFSAWAVTVVDPSVGGEAAGMYASSAVRTGTPVELMSSVPAAII
jgi:hypothetical protein